MSNVERSAEELTRASTWKGQLLTDYSKDELIEIIDEFARRLREQDALFAKERDLMWRAVISEVS